MNAIRRLVPVALLFATVAGCGTAARTGESGSMIMPLARGQAVGADLDLTRATGEEICGLLSPESLAALGFPSGRPVRGQDDLTTKSCRFDGTAGLLMTAQGPGTEEFGEEQVDIAGASGWRRLRGGESGDCTIVVGVRGAALQVVVAKPGADERQCDTAEAVTTQALSRIVR